MADRHTEKMHKDHRDRVRKQAAENGVDSLETYKLIELFLFGSLPRIDTYAVSHRLLDTFGTVEGIFSASREELLKVYGIGPKTADHIIATGELITRCVVEKMTGAPVDSDIRAVPVIMWLLRNSGADSALVLGLDKDGVLKMHRVFLPNENTDSCEAYIGSIPSLGCKSIIFAHKHPGKDLKPSAEDIKVTERMVSFCRENGIVLREHYIVNDTDAFGIIKNRRRTGKA